MNTRPNVSEGYEVTSELPGRQEYFFRVGNQYAECEKQEQRPTATVTTSFVTSLWILTTSKLGRGGGWCEERVQHTVHQSGFWLLSVKSPGLFREPSFSKPARLSQLTVETGRP